MLQQYLRKMLWLDIFSRTSVMLCTISSKGKAVFVLCEVTGGRVNRDVGLGLEIPCVYRFYGNKKYLSRLEQLLCQFVSLINFVDVVYADHSSTVSFSMYFYCWGKVSRPLTRVTIQPDFICTMNMGKIVGTLPHDRFKLADHLTQVTAKSGSIVLSF